MSLTETVDFDNRGEVVRHSHTKRFFLILVITLVALLSFGIGRLSGRGDGASVKIENTQALNQSASALNAVIPTVLTSSAPTNDSSGAVYASSKGKKYYYPWCKSTVSDSNKITFSTPAMAESAGYTLATNCSPR